jgi:L-iditol 2-dehydrogenase
MVLNSASRDYHQGIRIKSSLGTRRYYARAAKVRGRIVVVACYENAVAFEPHQLIKKNVKIIPDRSPDWQMAFNLINAGKMKAAQAVSHTFPLDKIKEAFETAIDVRSSIKVVIDL